MNTIRAIFVRTAYVVVILAVVLSVGRVVAHAAPTSPFLGRWQTIDPGDGSDIRLVIAGPANGPFQITWTESYFGGCGGEAGIVRGTGQLSNDNPNILEAHLTFECFRSGQSNEFDVAWHYHPTSNTLSTRDENGFVTIWHRPGKAQAVPPALNLRVNYGHDWVESFYEGGHTVWISVTESDGVTLKATAELFTAPREEWGGESGFQTRPEDWSPAPVDIQPYDRVYGWVDNGASAAVQIGDISGSIDLAADSIVGTINASWFSDEVEVECHSWGAPLPEEILKYDMTFPDGSDTYSCSWAGEWDIQPGQDVGVAYTGPDGQWVANVFQVPERNPRIIGSEVGNWFWTTEFNPGTLYLFIYESLDGGANLLWSGQRDADDGGFVFVGDHGLDLLPGNYLVVSDGVNQKELVLKPISVTFFDTASDFMAGFAPAGSEVWVAAGPQEWQVGMLVTADPDTGAWTADFSTIPFDITEDMRSWSYAQIFDEDEDINEANPPPAEQ